MTHDKLLVAIVVCLGTCGAISAEQVGQTEMEQQFVDLEHGLRVDEGVQQAAYVKNAPPAALYAEPLDEGPALVYPASIDRAAPTNLWYVNTELISTQSHLTGFEFGSWPDEPAAAVRLMLGVENPSGIGVRGRLWTFGQDVSAPATDLMVGATTFSIDVYKHFRGYDGDFVLGAAPAVAALRFELPDGRASDLQAAGISVFAEGYHTLCRFEKSELGAVGRARMSLAQGEWTDTTGTVVPATHDDSLTVLEAAIGLEYRRCFGRCDDKFWYIGVTEEIQQWDSPWMTTHARSDVVFHGVNLNFGLGW